MISVAYFVGYVSSVVSKAGIFYSSSEKNPLLAA